MITLSMLQAVLHFHNHFAGALAHRQHGLFIICLVLFVLNDSKYVTNLALVTYN